MDWPTDRYVLREAVNCRFWDYPGKSNSPRSARSNTQKTNEIEKRIAGNGFTDWVKLKRPRLIEILRAPRVLRGSTAESRIMDFSEIAKGWAQRGFSCEIWSDPPGQVWADFVHGVDELVMLVAGEIEVSFRGQTLRPRIGEEILIPANASHTVRNIGKTRNRWLYGYKKG